MVVGGSHVLKSTSVNYKQMKKLFPKIVQSLISIPNRAAHPLKIASYCESDAGIMNTSCSSVTEQIRRTVFLRSNLL